MRKVLSVHWPVRAFSHTQVTFYAVIDLKRPEGYHLGCNSFVDFLVLPVHPQRYSLDYVQSSFQCTFVSTRFSVLI